MKNLIIILFFLPLSVMSQSFGIKAGLTISNSNPSSENMIGYSFGGFGSYNLNKVFSINGDLIFTNYRYDFKNPVTTQSGDNLNNFSHYNFNKIELPIYFKAKAKEGILKPFAYFGTSQGINIYSHFKQDSYIGHPSNESKLNNVNALNVSLIPGIGFEVKDHFMFDLRYSIGLTNQYKNQNIKINSLYLTLGYRF